MDRPKTAKRWYLEELLVLEAVQGVEDVVARGSGQYERVHHERLQQTVECAKVANR